LYFNTDGTVTVEPLRLKGSTINKLESNLMMFFTGYSRSANEVLGEQKAKSESNDADMIANLDAIKAMGYEIKDVLESGDVDEFGLIMNRHWEMKKKRSSSMSNPLIDRCYEKALASGALGGKLVGAGAGGFLLFYTRNQAALREAMVSEGLEEIPFSFDFSGTTVLVRD